jgi:hypothetical protein
MKQQHETRTAPGEKGVENGVAARTAAVPPFRAAAARRSTGRTQDVDRHVGAGVRERRIMLGLTQQQLADLIGGPSAGAQHERIINFRRPAVRDCPG